MSTGQPAGPDGIGSYAAYDGDLPPMAMWSQQEASQPAAAPAQPMSPEMYAAVEAQMTQQQEERSVMPLSADPYPFMQPVVARADRGPRAVSGYVPVGSMLPDGDAGDRALLGAAFLLVGAGSAIGAAKAGIFGSIAGALYGGAAVNAVRSVRSARSDKKEAVLSGTFAVLGAGLATYLIWKDKNKTASRDGGR